MLNWIIDTSLRHRGLVVVITILLAVGGAFLIQFVNVDAFPDTTPVQVQINTTAPSLTPEEVEQQITFRIEQAISGLPGLQNVRSISKFGLSQVVVTFKDDMDIYFVRTLLDQNLATVNLPDGIERPKMGPVSTGLGEVFHYVVRYEDVDLSQLTDAERETRLTELRTVHDWVVKPQLRTVTGVAEINSWGGFEKQFHVRIDPVRLIKHELTFDQIVAALQNNNRNVGGGNIIHAGEMWLVHGVGRTVDIDQINQVVITARHGVPIRIGQVADVQIGHEIRRGAVTADGQGEVVLGLGFMLMGENSHRVTQDLKKKLAEIKPNLPTGITIDTVYDRTSLVDHVLQTVRKNLFEGGLLVIAVLFLFLGNLRAGLIVALAIPLSMLFAFSGMIQFGIVASLLSLGAIDFGLVVDSSVVMVENCVRCVSQNSDPKLSRLDVVRAAAIEVRKPTMFGELIIMIVYLPILTLEGVEGKLFRPMALTVIFALAGSMIMSMTLMPVLASWLLPRHISHRDPLLVRIIKRIYAPILKWTMRNKLAVIGFAVCLLVVAFGMIAPNLGSEFTPKLSEGAIAINVVRLAGTSLEESVRYNTIMERELLKQFPDEIIHTWSRIGSAEIATDPMGIELTDLFISLKPRSAWRRATTQAELTALIERTLRDLPGQGVAFTQPIELRMNEMVSGVRADIAVKVYGDDLDLLVEKAQQIEGVLNSIDGSADVATEQVTGQPVLRIKIRQDEIARYDISASAVLDLVESIGGKPVGEIFEGQLRFPLMIRLPEKYRLGSDNIEAIKAIEIPTALGERVPLERLADVTLDTGPATIQREWSQRRVTVSCNIRGRDMGSFVEEAQRKVASQVTMPGSRYRVEFGGQFENLQRARARLMIVVPVALALIFVLLYMTYNNVVDTLRVFSSVPFAWVGGIVALWIRDMPFSISAAVGFIALSGVAVLDDMLLVSYIRQLRRRGIGLEEAVETAAMTRLRPVLMTALVASAGFVPMAFSTGMGAEIQRPLATVVIGGVFSALIMSLLVLRVLYMVFRSSSRLNFDPRQMTIDHPANENEESVSV